MDTVNMKNAYHHGDLKSTLVDAGVKLLSESGMEGLSLRKLAREIGVSHNAPYMHFADKEAVLAAIAQQGFLLLGQAVDAGQLQLQDHSIESSLKAAAHSYIHFALDHPNHLMVMFGKLDSAAHCDLMESANATFGKLVTIMQNGKQSGALVDQPAEQLAMLFWTNLHGLSVLLIAQKLPDYARQGLSDEALIAWSVQMLLRGILRN
jgi:AcrR family transcriptional regulator